MTLVDTNVILDILSDDPVWLDWSADQLAASRDTGPLQINEITYAELAAQMEVESRLHSAIGEIGLHLERTPTHALFLAGRAFYRYRTAGGIRTSALPDFFIGAHAAAAGIPLLTRDTRRYRSYFPNVRLIAPEEPRP